MLRCVLLAVLAWSHPAVNPRAEHDPVEAWLDVLAPPDAAEQPAAAEQFDVTIVLQLSRSIVYLRNFLNVLREPPHACSHTCCFFLLRHNALPPHTDQSLMWTPPAHGLRLEVLLVDLTHPLRIEHWLELQRMVRVCVRLCVCVLEE